ncbi:ribonuclease R, partial [Acinetobacter baumannii]|nr:ribonuclease R [Acinetobacter baumannii]
LLGAQVIAEYERVGQAGGATPPSTPTCDIPPLARG